MLLKESIWIVVGAGPCGIASVGRLIELNVKKVRGNFLVGMCESFS